MAREIDRRNYERLRTLGLKVEFKIKGSDNIFKVDVINICAGGICFIRDAIININDVIQIKFPFKSRKIILTGRVLRIDGKEVAVKFLNTEEELDRFVKIFNKEYIYMKKESLNIDDRLYSLQITDKEVGNDDDEEDDKKMLDINIE